MRLSLRSRAFLLFLKTFCPLFIWLSDQASKQAILSIAGKNDLPIDFGSFLTIILIWNPGISFGLFSQLGVQIPLIILTLILVIFLFAFMVRVKLVMEALGLGLIIGGALGNLTDRIRFGAVVDFIDLHIGPYHWPAFNIADSAIVAGAAIWAGATLFSAKNLAK